MIIQEKIARVQRSIKTFKDLLNDVRVKNTSVTQEFAQYWPEIESFLKDSKIVFEFEGYFTGSISKGRKSVALDEVSENIAEFMHEYFWYEDNVISWHKVDVYANNANLTRDAYANTFSSAEEFRNKFNFNHPKFGFAHDKIHGIYIEAIEDHDVIDQIKTKLKQVFNAQVITSDKYHQHKKQEYPDHWFIEHDGSLSNRYDDYEPFEIVSPYTSIKEAPKLLNQFKTEVFDYFEGINDETTGGHINITCPHDKLDFLKLIMLADDNRWLKTFNREFNTFCESQYLYVLNQIQNLPNNMKIEEIIASLSIKPHKYMSFNFLKTSPPTIEFRVPGDDYLGKKFNETQRAFDWFVYTIAVGLNKRMFRQEYLAKVAKIYLKSRGLKESKKPSPFIARFIYFMKDNDEAKENVDDLIMHMLNFIIRNKNIKISKKDREDFKAYCFPPNSISGLEYKRRFKQLLFVYLTDVSFVHNILRNYHATNMSHIQAIIKQSIYHHSMIDFTLNDNEQELQNDLNYMIPEFIGLCATLGFNFTLVDYKGLDRDAYE